MKAEEIQRIFNRLPDGEIRFPYFKDRYALMLLSYLVGEGLKVRDVKGTRYAGLLDKPIVRELTRSLPDGRLTAAALRGVRGESPQEYVVTLGMYGDGEFQEDQTSRLGYNLVVHLNFPDEHDQALRRMVAPDNPNYDLTPYSGHPASDTRKTMAWVRIDIDSDGIDALVEEVQNDWIRVALGRRDIARGLLQEENGIERFRAYVPGATCAPRDFIYYVERALAPHVALWREATLAAALWILVELLEVPRIFYHTPRSGGVFKGVWDAPRSLYTDLPRKFCFRETRERPSFLAPAMIAAQSPMVAVAAGEAESSPVEGASAEQVEEDIPFHLLEVM